MVAVFFGNGERGVSCLKAVLDAGWKVTLVVGHPRKEGDVCALARQKGIPTANPDDPNAPAFLKELAGHKADVFVMAGYGKIFRKEIIALPKVMCVNLHGGKLPERRGSSPMNWAIIEGRGSFTLSVIKVDTGVDSGDVLLDKTFPIGPEDTIKEVHEIANREFPIMLVKVLTQIKTKKLKPRKQNKARAAYYPLRFADDGVILWDMLTAQEIHNRIRALTKPYPCASTFFKGQEVELIASRMTASPFYGEPGRVYQKCETHGLLVCAKDRSLWIKEAYLKDGTPLFDRVNRYDSLATVRAAAVEVIRKHKI